MRSLPVLYVPGSKRLYSLNYLEFAKKLADLISGHLKIKNAMPSTCYLREHFTLLFLHISIKKKSSSVVYY